MQLGYKFQEQGNLMTDTMAGVPLEKAAQVRLNNLGLVKRHAFFINNPNCLKHLRERLEMTKLLGLVQAIERQEVEKSREVGSREVCTGSCDKTYHQDVLGGENLWVWVQKKHARAILVSIF